MREPGAVEQGERAEASSCSGARSPPTGDGAPVPQVAAGCAVNPAGRITRQVAPGLRKPKPSDFGLFAESSISFFFGALPGPPLPSQALQGPQKLQPFSRLRLPMDLLGLSKLLQGQPPTLVGFASNSGMSPQASPKAFEGSVRGQGRPNCRIAGISTFQSLPKMSSKC